ncbi:arylsulfatase [Chitinophaga agrisoli]|uniref:Arylsulfatase n=1 Tax=Chitinophaga agrisoli TaxID=2607653 RepID=A0A5B2VJ81_9BACT|nr:arylsulfatase [Chitinophaga agrisoli]KAA2238402.1 arylsulfatase [Chitinophaga agrisoli]
MYTILKKMIVCAAAAVALSYSPGACQAQSRPNIIIIYTDDVGYGDVGCYGATGVKTPNIDALAAQGLRFTDAHCTAATCTPSRVSLLTGSYAFRNKAAILPGDAPLLIRPGTPTLPGMLQKEGYKTAVVGKWHLGLGSGNINWNGDISPGPLEIGFDYSYLLPATADRVPTVYIEDHRMVNADATDPLAVSYEKKIGNEPTGLEQPGLLRMKADTQHSNTIVNGISRIGYQTGGKKAWWKDEDFAMIFTAKAKQFINTNKDRPFFLYFSLTDIHVPRSPNPAFVGKTAMGPRGDAIVEMDWCVGEIMKEIQQLGISKNTLIIFSSDNGPVLNDGYEDLAVEKLGSHKPAGPFRGGKYSAFEGGTRVPVIVSWPGAIKPGASEAMVSQVDWYASFARLVHHELAGNEAPDSFDMLAALLGTSNKGRDTMLEESGTLAIRAKEWKYIRPIAQKGPLWMKNKKIETGFMHVDQLYNLQSDKGEQRNIANEHQEITDALKQQLKKAKQRPTRPGWTGQGK